MGDRQFGGLARRFGRRFSRDDRGLGSRDGCTTTLFAGRFHRSGRWRIFSPGIKERLAHGRDERLAFHGGLKDHPVTGFRAAAALGYDMPARASDAPALCTAPHAPHIEADSQTRSLHGDWPIRKVIDSCTLRSPNLNRNSPAARLPTMEILTQLIDWVLHIDRHLNVLIQDYGSWIYAIMFLIIFCETGLVVTPILPGDSLLFALGALAAQPDGLSLTTLAVSLIAAAILGDSVNYWIGSLLGPRIFRGEKIRFLNPKHLERTHDFYERHGFTTIILARFVPIVRTFAPFVAGMGRMTYRHFMIYNVTGGIAWILLFLLAGWGIGNHPEVKKNFGYVILGIIIVSILPMVWEIAREWLRNRGPDSGK
jgi:membrane-associated protein